MPIVPVATGGPPASLTPTRRGAILLPASLLWVRENTPAARLGRSTMNDRLACNHGQRARQPGRGHKHRSGEPGSKVRAAWFIAMLFNRVGGRAGFFVRTP